MVLKNSIEDSSISHKNRDDKIIFTPILSDFRLLVKEKMRQVCVIMLRSLILILGLAIMFCAIPRVKATTWIQTKYFYRNGGTWEETTESFTCNHMDWRITWLYHPWEGGSVFRITVYRADTNEVVTEINDDFRYILTKTGERYISGNNGTFYLKIHVENIAYVCEIKIEQDMDSPGSEAPTKQKTSMQLSLEPSETKKDGLTSIIATLLDQYGNPIPNQFIGFNLETAYLGMEKTDSSGIARKTCIANVSVGIYSVNVSYGGNLDLLPCAASGNLSVVQLTTRLRVAAPTVVQRGKQITLNATLRDENGKSLPAMNIEFQTNNGSLWSTVGFAETDQNGYACIGFAPMSMGAYQVRAIFAGNTDYSQGSDTCAFTVEEEHIDPSLFYYVSFAVVCTFCAVLGYIVLRRKRLPK